MREAWLSFVTDLAGRDDHVLYSGARKIFRGITWQVVLDDSLQLADIGYTRYKLRQLERNYVHRESWEMAQVLWERRVKQNKYGSVGFSCFNHLVKGKGDGHTAYWNRVNDKMKGVDPTAPTSLRASVMGPCIQSVTLTLLKKGAVEVDVFYRTTEVLKKFPADLVFLRDILLKPFGVEDAIVTMHFANLTLHPMYWVTILPMIKKPIAMMNYVKESDPFFFKWVVKWTARYLCEEHGRGIQKFSQALRVRDAALALIPNPDKIAKYLRRNHPGFRACKNSSTSTQQ